MARKMYLGDSVYVELDGEMLKLTTENEPSQPSNTIYLEFEVYDALVEYVQSILKNKVDQVKGDES